MITDNHIASQEQIDENVVKKMNREFDEVMFSYTPGKKKNNFNVVCKYIGCTFRLGYTQSAESEDEN